MQGADLTAHTHCDFERPVGGVPAAQQRRQSLRFLYAPYTLSISFLYTPSEDNSYTRQSPYDGEFFMSVLDGVSLLLAAGLFVYLLVALLRAGRVEE